MLRCLDEKPREVIGVLESRKESTLARKVKNGWSLMESQWDFHPQYKPEIMYELLGETKVTIYLHMFNIQHDRFNNQQNLLI